MHHWPMDIQYSTVREGKAELERERGRKRRGRERSTLVLNDGGHKRDASGVESDGGGMKARDLWVAYD